MASTHFAITAIRNIKQENFVAATLDQIGWTLLVRAMSTEALNTAIERHPQAVIITAEDFEIDRALISNPLITIDSKEELTGFILQDLLRRVSESDLPQSQSIPRCTSAVTLITTVDAGVGGTTVAINIAQEYSRLGRRTLLLDFNSVNPSLARYFDIQRINRKISPTQFGFSLGEASDTSFLSEIAVAAEEFEEVVIDLGKIIASEHLISGVRIQEVMARWSMQSAANIFIVSRSDADALNRLKLLAPYSLQYPHEVTPKILLVSHSPISTREAKDLKAKAETIFGGDVRLLPKDARAIDRATIERAPLLKIAPKSPLAREFSSLVAPSHKRER